MLTLSKWRRPMDCRVKPGNDEVCVAHSSPTTSAPIQLSNSHVESPVLFEAPGAPLVFSLAKQSEGSGAPGGAACNFSTRSSCGRARRRPARHRRIAPPAYLRRSLRRRAPLSHRGFYASGSASSWQGTLVSPGGAPTPPGAQGRRSLKTRAPHLTPSTDITG